MKKKIEGNCLKNCKHYKYRDLTERVEYKDEKGEVYAIGNEYKGTEWYCDKGCDEAKKKWFEENGTKPYKEAEKCCLECYEPDELYAKLHECVELARGILDNIKKKEEVKE